MPRRNLSQRRWTPWSWATHIAGACVLGGLLGCGSLPIEEPEAQPEISHPAEAEAEDSAAAARRMREISDRLIRLEEEIKLREDADRWLLTVQGTLAEAGQYERILETITAAAELNTSQLACVEALEGLREARTAVREGVAQVAAPEVLARGKQDLEDALYEAKGCVVNYGEVAFAYYRLDSEGRGADGRSVPGGLNPKFAVLNQQVVDKVLATCKKEGTIHLYGYSCDLGTPSYDERLAEERANNLADYLETLVAEACPDAEIRIAPHLGGIVELIDAEGKAAEIVEAQREKNRVVALFLFNG